MIIEKCYAKINLVLNVLNKREDSYHEIDFIMCSLDLHDVVKVSLAEEDEIICDKLQIEMKDNLAYKALDTIRLLYNIDQPVKIEIEKNIPIAGGMAGGSSDAAGVLRACNLLFNLELSLEALAEIGAKIGSDVSYCIYQDTRRAQGRGEILTKIDLPIKNQSVLVINPDQMLSTKLVYDNYQVKKANDNINLMLNSNSYQELIRHLHNDLSDTTIKLCDLSNELLYEINSIDEVKAIVSGSGPTVIVFSTNTQKLIDLKYKYEEIYDTVILSKMR